jgi:nitroimidazol reductase NimA-like FMN-containing flavoprotein (pyridoxamine 5'-phosphate oxidase superfamily)/ribosomal protein S18 acetylase RimI-like enzyme
MRNAIYRGEDEEGRALLARARAVHLALVSADGTPILRTVDGVVSDGRLAFHGAPAGEKMEGLGRPAVASAEEIVATIPSYFLDPERACPATTYYVSAQAHGVLEEITDPGAKARVLSALMGKLQPEGGHTPITADDPLYAKAVRGLLVAGIELRDVTCKAKLGQNKKPEERVRVLEGLWRRGAPGDARAIAMILARFPELPLPAFLRGPAGTRLVCDVDDLDEPLGLLEGAYWLAGLPRGAVREPLARATARVGARDASGRLIAFARALSDGKVAWIYDVIVAPSLRGSGVGAAVMELVLDHPAVRGARVVRLGTRDAMRFYERLGFRDVATTQLRPYRTTEMIRTRP